MVPGPAASDLVELIGRAGGVVGGLLGLPDLLDGGPDDSKQAQALGVELPEIGFGAAGVCPIVIGLEPHAVGAAGVWAGLGEGCLSGGDVVEPSNIGDAVGGHVEAGVEVAFDGQDAAFAFGFGQFARADVGFEQDGTGADRGEEAPAEVGVLVGLEPGDVSAVLVDVDAADLTAWVDFADDEALAGVLGGDGIGELGRGGGTATREGEKGDDCCSGFHTCDLLPERGRRQRYRARWGRAGRSRCDCAGWGANVKGAGAFGAAVALGMGRRV
jgi:hypothetical protein